MSTTRIIPRSLGALAFAAMFAACSDSLSLDVGATGEVAVQMQRMSGSSLSSLLFQQQNTETSPRAVSPDTVASLTADITAIQFLRAGSDSSDNAAWTSLRLDAPVHVDFMALPSEGSSPLVIASGRVAVGSYSMVRLFVSNPHITFKGSISFGTAGTLSGGVEYAVTIPSSAQTGVKTEVSFSVEASASDSTSTTADVPLLFDEGSTFANVAVTGTGTVMVAPVFRAR